jgi:ABC-type polysaccharide/polyol phosphate export permease
VYPVLTIWKNRSLIRTMVRRDILGRYRGSFGGAFWTLLNPLLLMLTYFFVFGVVLNAKFGNDPSRSGFALYFLAGMLPWLAFSEAAGRAPWVMLEHRNFVKKLVFAVETLPFNLVISGLVSEIFGLLLFSIGFLIIRGTLPLSVLWLPVLIVPQILFAAGVAWFLAALGVFVRDPDRSSISAHAWFFSRRSASGIAASDGRARSSKIRSTCWCGATETFSWKDTRPRSDRCGSCGSSRPGLRGRTRLVLQAAQIIRRYYLNQRMTFLRAILTRWFYGPGEFAAGLSRFRRPPVSAGMDALIAWWRQRPAAPGWWRPSLSGIGGGQHRLVFGCAQGAKLDAQRRSRCSAGRTGPLRTLVPRVRHDHDFRARRSAGDPAAPEGIRDLGGDNAGPAGNGSQRHRCGAGDPVWR